MEIAKCFDLNTEKLIFQKNLKKRIRNFLLKSSSGLCEVILSENHRVIPQVKFGKPNEDPEPLLSRKEFNENMIIKTIS